MMKNILLIFLVALIFCLFTACEKKNKHLIGISHSGLIGEWGQNQYDEIIREASFHTHLIDLKFIDAGNNYIKQRQDIQQLIKDKIDVLIVFPSHPDSISDIITQTHDMGIPVIVVDRLINNAKYNTFVGTNDVQIGKQIAQYIGKRSQLPKSAIEIKGPSTSFSALDRNKGFADEIVNWPNISVTHSLFCKWDESAAYQLCDSLFANNIRPDYIFAHNDVQAKGISLACKKHQISPIIIGIDALARKNGGVDLIINGEITATWYNPPGGKESIELAINLLGHKSTPKHIELESFVVDSTNAIVLKRQYQLLVDQQQRIDLQQIKINDLTTTITNQRLIFSLMGIVVGLLILVIILTVYFVRKKQKLLTTIKHQKEQITQQFEEQVQLRELVEEKNTILAEQNAEIEAQHDAIYAQNQELTAYSNQMELLVEKRTEELKAALDKAMESDRLKTAFLSNLSHELRTPLNAIIGFSDLFVIPDCEYEERLGLQRVMKKNTEELLVLINNIIELSELTTHQIQLHKESTELTSLFNDIRQQINDYLHEGLWELHESVELSTSCIAIPPIMCDGNRIKEVMTHLIHNAIKYTQHGRIEFGYKYFPNERKVRLYVVDTGTGIQPEYQPLIFERFRKIENDNLVLYRGAGMGLTIARALVNLMGSDIELASVYGKGSTFWFDLPTN
ncbi:signal transduction histidine kinase [Breznakibacter xylanolyticus]|uniref:histidine kinase n=2 Tax=Breznakibacter xylanolyticus TaxID=990 RepID=A0A2W7N094_9BACT|nr:signal transduction histidine kinase [Breznakibacter xylanolyticus]